MVIKFCELYELLHTKLGWEKLSLELGTYNKNTKEILKHPNKFLYLDQYGCLGNNWRIYKSRQVDIFNRIFTFPLYKQLDFNDKTGLVIVDDLIAIKLI